VLWAQKTLQKAQWGGHQKYCHHEQSSPGGGVGGGVGGGHGQGLEKGLGSSAPGFVQSWAQFVDDPGTGMQGPHSGAGAQPTVRSSHFGLMQICCHRPGLTSLHRPQPGRQNSWPFEPASRVGALSIWAAATPQTGSPGWRAVVR
jgi:hypothetical protein